jgi:hypothetical protein
MTAPSIRSLGDKIGRSPVVGTLVGVSMFFSGITRLMLSVAARGIVA